MTGQRQPEVFQPSAAQEAVCRHRVLVATDLFISGEGIAQHIFGTLEEEPFACLTEDVREPGRAEELMLSASSRGEVCVRRSGLH